ncbi:MAG: response regulator [Desulfotignum sp.]|nr:response regulator [Desulfotignum sp.]
MRAGSNPAILIVDDTKTNVDVLVQTLKNDYKIGVSLNGRDAIRFARTNKPDLILLDIVMPKMDGFQVCKKLKSDPETRDIPIIFITAMDKPDQKKKCLKCGGADYITKPFVTSEIKKKIKKHI